MKITAPENMEDPAAFPDNNIFFSEKIWGHRVRKSQTGSQLLMEFLGMVAAKVEEGKAFEHTSPSTDCTFITPKSLELRLLLFNNPSMEVIADKYPQDDEKAWEEWIEEMKRVGSDSKNSCDFSYLKEVDDDFQKLFKVVELLRRITLDAETSKRWTDRFLFPIAPSALYVSLDNKHNVDRNAFTRAGELAYLMLSRADEGLREKLAEGFTEQFKSDPQKDNLVKTLLDPAKKETVPRKGTYLPYKKHPAYNRFAEDLCALFNLDLPGQDVFKPMQTLIGFHVYLYIIETTQAWVGEESLPPIICEIIGPRSDLVRRKSGASKRENEDNAQRAMKKFLEVSLSRDSKIAAILVDKSNDDEDKAKSLVKKLGDLFQCSTLEGDTADQVKKATISKGSTNLKANILAGLTTFGRSCGLVSRLKTNQFRYAPSDLLLETLVLVNVVGKVEEKLLLETLQRRYSFIIGHRQAENHLNADEYEKLPFAKNGKRFTERLVALGLAKSLSDACTYVSNPHT